MVGQTIGLGENQGISIVFGILRDSRFLPIICCRLIINLVEEGDKGVNVESIIRSGSISGIEFAAGTGEESAQGSLGRCA